MEPIRLLFLGTTFALGGAERILSHLARGLNRPPFTVEILALRAPGPLGEELRACGLPVHSGLTHEGRFDPWLLPRLRRFLRRGRYQILYALDHAHAVFYGCLAAAGLEAQVRVMPVHTTGQWNGRPSLRRPIRLVRRRLDRIIAIAEAQRRYLIEEEGIPAEQLVVIPNGIPPSEAGAEERRRLRAAVRAEMSVPEGATVCGITAVLRPEKNHELCLHAFARARARLPRAELWVVGDGPRRTLLEESARGLGLSYATGTGVVEAAAEGRPAVRFLGSRPDARRLMAAMDLALLTSHPRVETSPLSLMEAMDAGCPVISTRVGAIEELVEDGASGILVPPGDEEGLAAAITELLQDPSRRSGMGERGREIVRRDFSVARMVGETEALLLQLLAEKS